MNRLLRSLRRQKEFAVLNVLGLGVGIGSALVLFLLVRSELSTDRYHKNLDRIYRVVSTETYRNGTTDLDGDAPIPLVDGLRAEFPEVELAGDVVRRGFQVTVPGTANGTGTAGEKAEKKFQVDVDYVDPAVFQIFDMPWIAGDPQTALNDIQTMAISQTTAETWFGHWQDAIGKTVLLNDDHRPFRITGIMKDPPGNTDVEIKVALSFATYRHDSPGTFTAPENWDNFSSGVQCYFLLRKGATIAAMNRRLPQFVARHFTPLFANSDSRDSSFFQPLSEMHFDSRLGRPGRDGLSYTNVIALVLIGCFLLLVACVNFINLATALSVNRAREIGVRKVLGSNRNQLLWRFMAETAFLVLCSALIGCILAEICLGPVDRLLNEQIGWVALFSPATLLFLLVTVLAVTCLAGLYPGIVMAGFNPIGVLKNKITSRTVGGISLRRGLVAFQFVTAQLLIICTLVVVRQLHYFNSRPMGFDKNAVAIVGVPWGNARLPAFKNDVLQIPGVQAATFSNGAPASNSMWESGFTYDTHAVQEGFEVIYKFGDADYLSTFRVPLSVGRPPYPSDTIRETVVNEALVRGLGLRSDNDILGKTIRLTYNSSKMTVVGVTKDFVTTSMIDKIKPMLLMTDKTQYYEMGVRIDPARIRQVMPQMQALFEKAFPEHIWDAKFLDRQIQDFYQNTVTAGTLFKVFAALAIFISCLGLYGLVSFMATQRIKEVGIRKVLGASVQSIVYLFSREFTLLVAGAFLLSAPAGYYVMHQWLQTFYFQIDIGWDVFVFALAASILIAWATVGYRAVRAALADPAKALKYE